ncbi:T3SS effector HopA1 family protein [Yoonia sp. GPGPB17]|uniref:T3SS effector HopA1 family protein n=1 Tax=Yoonia sp. GPGPB17 TaxID=3026147 RepID=UPI0030BF82FA
MTPALGAFVAQVGINAQDQITFKGQPVQRASQSGAPFELQLTEFAYKYFYTHPSGQIGDAFGSGTPSAALIADISAANTTVPKVEDGWVVRSVLAEGSVMAERFGTVRKFIAGQFLAAPDAAPVRSGSEITVTHLAGSKTVQPGFFHIFGQEHLDAAEEVKNIRLYFNLTGPGAAAPVAGLISQVLNDYLVPFRFKTATRICDFSRVDTAVLYLPQRVFTVAAMALATQLARLEHFLDDAVPPFTKPMGRGIGLAEDTPDAGSFGAARCKLVAQAIMQARADGEIDPNLFETVFKTLCAAQNLDVGRLYLNPGSDTDYCLNAPSATIAA